MIDSASGVQMGGAVGWLRAVAVQAMALPRPADVARRAYGPKGTPG